MTAFRFCLQNRSWSSSLDQLFAKLRCLTMNKRIKMWITGAWQTPESQRLYFRSPDFGIAIVRQQFAPDFVGEVHAQLWSSASIKDCGVCSQLQRMGGAILLHSNLTTLGDHSTTFQRYYFIYDIENELVANYQLCWVLRVQREQKLYPLNAAVRCVRP